MCGNIFHFFFFFFFTLSGSSLGQTLSTIWSVNLHKVQCSLLSPEIFPHSRNRKTKGNLRNIYWFLDADWGSRELFLLPQVAWCVFFMCGYNNSKMHRLLLSLLHKTRCEEFSSKMRYHHLNVVTYTPKYYWNYLKTLSSVLQVICSEWLCTAFWTFPLPSCVFGTVTVMYWPTC